MQHVFTITDTFKPYLEARDWISINRGVEVGFTEDGFEARGAAAEHAERKAAAEAATNEGADA